MSLNYKLLPKPNPRDPEQPPKWYAQAIGTTTIDLERLAGLISRSTTMSKGDIWGVLISIEEEIISALQSGYQVELGNLCTFYPTVRSEGVRSEKEFNQRKHIKETGVRIRPGKKIVNQLKKITLKRI